MSWIALPSSASQQGSAFEHLILSHYQEHSLFRVREWSSYLHGKSGKWYQCDGIVEDDSHRWLMEAKFFGSRPATVRDINPIRREQAAKDFDCTGVLYVSLNGFSDDMLSWPHDKSLAVQFVSWAEIQADVLSNVDTYASVFLDGFEIKGSVAYSSAADSAIYFETLAPSSVSTDFPEFISFPDGVERWLRRMPKLSLQRQQIAQGKFRYQDLGETVSLIPERLSDLSLAEAWLIEDALSGYAARVHSAVRATAQAMIAANGGFVQDVQKAVHGLGWRTGASGVRSSLNNLVLLGLVRKEREQRRVRYHLTPLGRAYVAEGEPDDDLLAQVLRDWPPYAWVRSAILERRVAVEPSAVADYFRTQYAPYEPYAKCLFNQNKSEGLVRLYQVFG
jgi:hypothetical protein